MFRRTDCSKPLEVPADGAERAVKEQPLFDAMSVRVIDERTVDMVQKKSDKVVWKGEYRVSKDKRTMTLDFEDDRAQNAVSGQLEYSREGNALAGPHALSGSWRPGKLSRLSGAGLSMTIEPHDNGLQIGWSDGRRVSTKLDAQYYPLEGYLDGAKMSVLHPRPDTLALNRTQEIAPVEISRAVLSADGETIVLKQVDFLCQSWAVFNYRKQAGT